MKLMSLYTLNTRPFTTVHPLKEELSFHTSSTYVFDLDYLGVLDIIGDSAHTFLQGQKTCDVNDVHANQMRPSAICNLQGRIMALLDVIDWQGLHLLMPKDLLEPTQHSLAKVGLFSKVTVPINPNYSVLGLYLPDPNTPSGLPLPCPQTPWQSTHNEQMYCYAISDRLFIILLKTDQKNALMSQFPHAQQRGSLAWHYLQLQIPRLSIYPNTRGLFLPHRLGLQHTPILSFKKGCYKGQEIIARTQYLAKLKHTLKSIEIESTEPLCAGQTLLGPQQNEMGEIIDYCPLENNRYLLLISAPTLRSDA